MISWNFKEAIMSSFACPRIQWEENHRAKDKIGPYEKIKKIIFLKQENKCLNQCIGKYDLSK